MKTILFYSSVKNLCDFTNQSFYQIDITLLKNLGFDVEVTNKKRKFLKFWKYDISFLYFYKWSFIPAIISRIFLKKVYFTGGIDDLAQNENSKIYKKQKKLFSICYFFATKCFIVSSADFEHINKITNNDKKNKVIKSLHSIDVTSFVENVNLNKKTDNFITIAWQGTKENLIRKGVDKAIILFSKLIKNQLYSNSKFYLIGTEGEGTKYLKELIESNSLCQNVILLGNISESEKKKYLTSCKYYFQLSNYEGFGLAAIEALASGCIVIHTGNGGLADGIANDGLKLDITLPINEQVSYLEEKLSDFDINRLISGRHRLLNDFSNTRRQKDFEIIKINN